MSSFDGNVVSDMVYDLLNVVGVTSIVGTRIWANRVPPGELPTYPSVQFSQYGDFRPERVLNGGTVTYKGQYLVAGWSLEDPRGARTLAKALQTAMSASTPAGAVDIYPGRILYDEEDEEGDGRVYIRAGAIYTIEVYA